MKHINVFTKYFSCMTFLLLVFLLTVTIASAQSRDPAHPTPIAAAPLTGRLAAGTYYYSMPVSAGPGTMGLQITAPMGGASISVALSGPDCCSAEAYVSASTGREETIRSGSERFTIPSAQTLLITINISVAAGDTARFTLSLGIGGGSGVVVTVPSPTPVPSSSGVIVTPPSPTPTPSGSGVIVTPPPSGAVCTDLAVTHFAVTLLTSRSKKISGDVFNITRTHPYKGYPGRQYVAVFDITDSVTRPRFVSRIFLPEIIDPGRSFHFATVHNVTETRRTRYEIRLRYSHLNAGDESPYNDDCNTANNTTRRELINTPLDEDGTIPLIEEVPKRKP